MTKLRILLYANVDAGEAGGVQAVVRGLRAHLRAQGHHVATGWAERSGPADQGDDGWAEQFPVRPNRDRWLHVPTMARLTLRLMRERPQVVHVHYASPSTRYVIVLAPWLGFRVVVTCHGSDILRPLAQDVAHLAPVLTGADAVTVVSQDIAARHEAVGIPPRRPLALIANGVDTGFWHPPAEREAAKEGVGLVAVGRLEPVKGFDVLIAACGLLARQGHGPRLVLIGEGSQQAALAEQARALGIADRVTFAGRLPAGAIRDRLHAADLFVLPSRSEGMPLALMEAMATGIAAVAADVGGVARTAGGAARLVPPEDPEALAGAIAALAADPAARTALARHAHTRAQELSVAGAHAAYEALMVDLARSPRT